MRWLALLLVALTLSLLAFVVVQGVGVARAFGGIDGEDLHYSVTREAGGTLPDIEPCEQRGSGTWFCEVNTKEVSGEAGYRVQLDERCWTAHKIPQPRGEGAGAMPGRASGCVGWRDRLFGGWL